MTQQTKTEESLIPIRELSALTGVNSVTIRAWERRYGLLKPQRTPKGHRLYGQSDVELIQEIQRWLDKGISIGKVKDLLKTRPSEAVVTDDDWLHINNQLEDAINSLDDKKVEKILNELTSTYPAKHIWKNIGQPFAGKYNAKDDGYGSNARFTFWLNCLKEKSHAYFRSHSKECTHEAIIISLDDEVTCSEEFFLGWQLMEAGMKPNFLLREVTLKELPLVLAHTNANCIVFFW
jgi:DNA-binding transcriptional MerR regulator